MVELNIAVLDSFQKAGVTIVDHHTAAQQYKTLKNKEIEKGEILLQLGQAYITAISRNYPYFS